MSFHSFDFLVFFVATVALYWSLPHRAQNVLLLAASYLFYGYVHPWFLLLIFASTFIDYWSARGMEAWPDRRKLFLWVSVVSNFGLLGFFKYFNFFVENVGAVLDAAGLSWSRPALSVALPVGISFYTFQTMSYTIDVYRGELRARRSLLDVAVFVSFFPHLVAGPIQRASYLLPQVEGRRRFSVERARSGFFLVCWGFFKKLVIADNVGVIANKVFAHSDPSFDMLWAGVFAFGIQIYADFSGYTDIARGTSRWLGFELTENFNHPYLATGPADFWRRWNISLSSWFRDYVYIPLGGSRGTPVRTAANIMATFLLSGLWHGASWNFVLWGFYHGVLLIAGRALSSRAPWGEHGRESRGAQGGAGWEGRASRLLVPLRIAGMFVLTNIGWLLFRETDLHFLVHDLTLSPFSSTAFDHQTGAYLFLLAATYSLPIWIHSAVVGQRHLAVGESALETTVTRRRRLALQTVAASLMFITILVLRSRTALDFIYFQF